MLALVDSAELSMWWALALVEAKEAKQRRDVEESEDGRVVIVGNDPDDLCWPEDENPDGETE